MKLHIKPGDLVLEVGSGDNPRPQSNILLDRFITTNHQRAGKFNMRIDRPLVVGDGYHLPFKDKSFDYVICSHVLEHLEDPVAFAKELMRVGKRGYVEVPNIYGERLFGWSFHLWHNEYKNGKLIMTAKKARLQSLERGNSGQEGERFGEFFHTLIAKQIWFRRFVEENESKFYIQFEWDKKFSIQVVKKPHDASYLQKIDADLWQLLKQIHWGMQKDLLFYCRWMARRIQAKSKKIMRKAFWKIRIVLFPQSVLQQLLPVMQCIACSGDVEIKNNRFVCINCRKKYPINGIIPIFLTENEYKKGY